MLSLVASEVLKLVEAAARAAHERSDAEPVKLLGGPGGCCAELADRDREHNEVDVLPMAEPHQLVGREIGSKVMYQPVVLA